MFTIRFSFKFSLACSLLCLVAHMQAADDPSPVFIDAKAELLKARAAIFSPGTYRTTSKTVDGRRTNIVTTTYRNTIDGRRLVRRESINRYPGFESRRVVLRRPDGMWALSPGVAIKVPMESKIFDASELIGELEEFNGPKVTYLAEQFTEEGKDYLRIIEILDPRLLKLIESKSDAIASSAAAIFDPQASAANRQKVAEDTKRMFPNRKEYVIDRESGFIVAEYTYSKSGERVGTKKIDEIERVRDFPDSSFEVPTGNKLLFPKSASAYFSLLREHRDKRVLKNNMGQQTNNESEHEK